MFFLQEKEYLVKWENYSSYECTWEPEHHLSQELTKQFDKPNVTTGQIIDASDIFFEALQRRLSQRVGHHFFIQVNHEMFRFFFETQGERFENNSRKLNLDDFSKMTLPHE